MHENICILGSTGSVGTQALEVADELGINVVAISANKNISLLEKQIRKFKPKFVSVFDEKSAKMLKLNISDTDTKVFSGIDGLCEISAIEKCDLVLTAVSGMIGLKPTITAINAKKDIALANKETLVVGGDLVMRATLENNVKILPVDSEHSAIFQCLQGCNNPSYIKRLILTASGGPFFGKSKKELENVTVEQALKHPSWNMGKKISIDSATLMNKGFEIIEASHLFNIDESKIDVIIHKESIIHSMVEYVDGSIVAQMGIPTMKTPIRYAITYPERVETPNNSLNLKDVSNLSFYEPDLYTFEAIKICRDTINMGGSAPIVVNAANEVAVESFLNKKIKFLDIIEIVKSCLNCFNNQQIKSVDDIINLDKKARNYSNDIIS